MYLVGEALVGDGSEVAHIDLLVGEKEGPVGEAFANSLSSLSAGHTPLLAIVRPNLPAKPSTLLVPKVTVKNLEETARIFGPAQATTSESFPILINFLKNLGELWVKLAALDAMWYDRPLEARLKRIAELGYKVTEEWPATHKPQLLWLSGRDFSRLVEDSGLDTVAMGQYALLGDLPPGGGDTPVDRSHPRHREYSPVSSGYR